jgi:hypothetical protein
VLAADGKQELEVSALMGRTVGGKIAKTLFVSMIYAIGALGGRSHLLRYQ